MLKYIIDYNPRVNYCHVSSRRVPMEYLRYSGGKRRINSNAYLNILDCQGCSVACNCDLNGDSSATAGTANGKRS